MSGSSRTLAARFADALRKAVARLADWTRKTLRVARWEAARTAGVFDRKTAGAAFAAALLVGAFGAAALSTGGAGVALDENIYRVGIAADSPYYDAVAESPPLAARPPDEAALRDGEIDALVRGNEVEPADSERGRAAAAAYRSAVQSYNDRRMLAEENQSAAFPVVVEIRYADRGGASGGSAATDAGSDTDSSGGDSADSDQSPNAESGSGASDGTGGSAGADEPSDGEGDGALAVPDVGGSGALFGGQSSGSPADIAPPFPFGSLVLAFAFLVPVNFVVQSYGSTMLNERINRRGELLLVAPLSPTSIVAGKTLPYALAILGVTTLIAALVGGGLLSVAAVFPLALAYLAATFVGAMFARSFKELTFVTVALSVFLTTYAFVPAIFTDVTPIALISPLTLVVRDLQGAAVSAGEYAFATGSFYFGSGVLFLLGVGVYREEDLFTQRSVPLKFLDALDSRLSGKRSVAVLSALFIPFVFVAELLTVAVLFALPVQLSMPLLLASIAAVEEFAKSVHVYAGFEKNRFERSVPTAVVLGSLSAVGFFAGEKVTAVVQLVGLPELALGRAAFATSGLPGIGPAGAVGLLLAPLLLHVVTASLTAIGASRNRLLYVASLVVAVAVHTFYNLAVVVTLA
ncbi:PrsW family intramembrane metalloprotease [Haloprofundus sp. MHR1]|uniref:PrsW family intramembrane metalloprotease n=1 Tax=Haloprofundus sp. MHR1 TaxID=2572921 RepID=UPI0010BEF795|nr:PrsW family intramembrane metalloprotease [Haloprofundus sp. MHR1]QCJ48019.1 PrsW family intramembrane metalloprotease [Haloprofundus sp. MHR1]